MKLPWRDRISAQPMFDVLSQANDREALGHYVARMEIGDTPGFRNDAIHKLLSKYSKEPHRYSPSSGEGALIESLFEMEWPTLSRVENEISVAPANFLITAALASVTVPGDLVLIPDPGFPTYELSCQFLGLQVSYYPIYPNPQMRFPNLESFCSENSLKPKVVIINNPSNPLGIAFDGKDVELSIKSLAHAGVEIIIDETYVNLVYDGIDPHIPNVAATRIRSFSKEHCAPGLRIGYAIAKKQHARVISDFISLTISCAPKFIQLAVAEYLKSDERIIFNKHVNETMSGRIDHLADKIPSNFLSYKPNSAFYALIETGNGAQAFDFLMSQNIATCPGFKFGNSTINTVRVSLSGLESRFEHDLTMLCDALKRLPSETQIR